MLFQWTKDKIFSSFLVKSVTTLNSKISFQIENLLDTSKNGEIKLFEAVTELKDFTEKNARNIKQ